MISPDDRRFDTFIEEIQIVQAQSNRMDNVNNRSLGAIPKNQTAVSALIADPKFEHKPKNFKEVVDKINTGLRVVVIIRGLPGSGKSFLAHQLIEETVKNRIGHVFSADDFFMTNRGVYKYDGSKIGEAHAQTLRLFTQSAAKGTSPLIVDNTNLEYWNTFGYLQAAVQYFYHIEFMEPATPWKFKEGILASKNQHSVPVDKIKLMKERYETGVDIQKLLKSNNLDPNYTPKMRNFPPIEQPDLMSFDKILQLSTPSFSFVRDDSPTKSASTPFWESPPKVFDEDWVPKEEEKEPIVVEKPKIVEPQPQRKQQKSKSVSPPAFDLKPHRKNCPNENPKFTEIRELFPNVNDAGLWDLFKHCNGDADWAVNVLYDENREEQMNVGAQLTCSCFGNVTSIATETVAINAKEDESPTKTNSIPKLKKQKQETSREETNNLKLAIEQSIQINQEHYPDHVKQVKSWKQPQLATTNGEDSPPIFSSDVCDSGSPDAEELHALPISHNLILALDEEYGGGLLKGMDGLQTKFPPIIFVKKSTAHKLYEEIMETFYSQEEEARLQRERDDEKLAKQLSEGNNYGKSTKNIQPSTLNGWKDEESEDDIALKISKEKLLEIFKDFDNIGSDLLLTIFASNNNNFEDTVQSIKDSLGCTPQQSAEIDKIKKKVMNGKWIEKEEKKIVVTGGGDTNKVEKGYTAEHLKTVENLREEIKAHTEEQQICHNKAQEAYRKKMYDVATYLSGIKELHRQQAEEKNHIVANMMAGIHEKVQDSSTSIDLHFLNVIEASTILDTFLDKNISRLRDINKQREELSIITGRGAHSANGVAFIKNKTIQQLTQRGLK
jgi:DNA-nicking Smr family endonuclease/predicted kinase